MKLNIYIDKRPNKIGLFPVRLSVSFFGRRFITSIGTNLSQQEFDVVKSAFAGESSLKKTSRETLKELLRQLHSISDALDWEQAKVKRGEIEPVDVDLPAVINKVLGRSQKGRVEPKKLPDYWHDFISDERTKKDLSEGTLRQLNYCRIKLFKYAKNKPLDELATKQGLQDWVTYNVENGVNNVTAKMYLNYLKWFLGWAYRSGYCGNEFERYKFNLKIPSKLERNVVFLTIDEIEALANVPAYGRMAISRDMFLFQCFTGLRISDVYKLRHSDVSDMVMRLKIQKTGTYIANKLNKQALAVLSKYMDNDGDTIFPHIVLHSIQTDIRALAKLAGINDSVTRVEYRNHERIESIHEKWELLTTHAGRRSFIVNSLDLNLTPTQVISYTGHSSIQAMEPYISISNKKKDSAMDVWDAVAESEKESIEDEIKRLEERLKTLKSKH
ncbi:MAG: integrase catalytic domain-containing protein [Bacteroidales bacterium]|nr:integrase catalytic domain-containing protein [Candidatus Colimorpha merdihippi]